MNRRTRWIAGGAAALALVAGGAGVAAAQSDGTGSDDADDAPLEGETLDKASAAALEEVGSGEVTETEADDEESAYEVEVTLDDGTEVDVQLDESFKVVSSTPDDDGPDDADEPDDADDANEPADD